jgi:hypothetical protein
LVEAGDYPKGCEREQGTKDEGEAFHVSNS